MNRTLLAFLVLIPLAACGGLVAGYLDLGSWARTGLACLLGLLVTLIDREGFYGPPPKRADNGG